MSKRNLTFVCQNCGAAFSRWQGKCEACGEWNTLSEEGAERPAGPGRKPGAMAQAFCALFPAIRFQRLALSTFAKLNFPAASDFALRINAVSGWLGS